jgi:RNA polymerase sigma-70 factor (ECF subfamily)
MARLTADQLAGLRPGLLKFARMRERNLEHAEDAVQDTLLAALEGIERFAGHAAPATWLNGILHHKIVDRLRTTGREQPLDQDAADQLRSGDDPERDYALRQATASLQRSLAGMPARTARVFILRDVVGHEVAEVCERLAITPNHCSVLLHRARARLRRCPLMLRFAPGS